MEAVPNDDSEELKLHPRAGEARFIPRLGQSQQRLGRLLSGCGITMTVSPLYFMQHNPELALFATDHAPMGLALDPCTHLRQLPAEKRAASFRTLPFGAVAGSFDPDHDPITEAELAALVTLPLELERARGATLLLQAFHVTGAIGTRGRELDLRVARASLAHFHQQRMAEPADAAAVPVQRELFIVIALRRELLSAPHELRRLAEAYLELDAAGFWVKMEGFDERASLSDIRAGGAFLRMLGSDDRPVVCCGPGQLHPGLLANEISSSVGIAEGERFRYPSHRPRSGWRSTGRTRLAYHPKYLRSFMVGRETADRAFGNSTCRCGAHPEDRAPSGLEVEEHGAVVRADESREALEGDVLDRREWVLASAAMASHLARDAGVDDTPGAVFEALFDGIDGVREQLDLTG